MAKVFTDEHISEGTRKDGYTVTVDLDKCISAGPCAIAAPGIFKLRSEDGKAIIGDPDSDDYQALMEAARCCPVLAIFIKDKDGKQLFP